MMVMMRILANSNHSSQGTSTKVISPGLSPGFISPKLWYLELFSCSMTLSFLPGKWGWDITLQIAL